MSIFTSWAFWVALATIVFCIALFGYLTDGKRKKDSSTEEVVPEEPTPDVTSEEKVEEPVASSTEGLADAWNSMPEVQPLESVNVEKIEEPVSTVQEVETLEVPVTPEATTPETLEVTEAPAEIEILDVPEVPAAEETEKAPEESKEEVKDDIWN